MIQVMTNNFAHKDCIDFEDTGVVNMKFENGAIGNINYTVNSFMKNMEGSLTIFGENGTIKIGGEYLNTLEYALVKDFSFGELPKGNEANNYGAYTGSMSNHDKIYENVVAVLNNNATISTSAFEGMKTVEIIERIYQTIQRVG
jgi:predicted dehydrogenase